jgi:hypothetical protein
MQILRDFRYNPLRAPRASRNFAKQKSAHFIPTGRRHDTSGWYAFRMEQKGRASKRPG